MTPDELADGFTRALTAHDAAPWQRLLHDDAALRLWGWRGLEAHRPRERVVRRLLDEAAGWHDATATIHCVAAGEERLAVEFRIQATDGDDYIEHNRAAFLRLEDDRVREIDLYCSEPLFSARRSGWIAPAGLSDEELERIFRAYPFTWDARNETQPGVDAWHSVRLGKWATGGEHPQNNGVMRSNWSDEEADERIAEVIEWHRARGIGFQWFVSKWDRPLDLRERLERSGLLLAGDQALMVRTGLDSLHDIPVNPDVTVEIIASENEAAMEAALQIAAVSFQWTPEVVADLRADWYEQFTDPVRRELGTGYLARLDGAPVAMASLMWRAGTAYLGGAATLPEYRSRKIYSTLLRRRLEDAKARGYDVAVIHAEPMSRRVVSRYGFQTHSMTHVYGWMPVMDPEVIRTLVQDQ